MNSAIAGATNGADVFFILMGGILVFAMHSGFAFLEVGTVRHKNQVNALVKILVDFAISTIAYFFVGYGVAYGVHFLVNAATLNGNEGDLFAPQGRDLVKFFFLLTFAAAIPAIISGGIAERARFWPQAIATRRPRSRGWRSAPGFSASAGSASTLCPPSRSKPFLASSP